VSFLRAALISNDKPLTNSLMPVLRCQSTRRSDGLRGE
jgi:hypothetical protein